MKTKKDRALKLLNDYKVIAETHYEMTKSEIENNEKFSLHTEIPEWHYDRLKDLEQEIELLDFIIEHIAFIDKIRSDEE